jgi:transcriptional regulator with GAF, ATPase, and Fis domain
MDNNDTYNDNNNDNNNRLLDKLLVEKYSLFKEMKIIDIIEKLEREKKQNKLIIKTAFNLFSSKKITNLIKEIVDSIYELLPAENIAVFTNLDPTEPYFEARVYESYREKALPDIPIIELRNNSKLIKYLSNYKQPIFYDVLIQKLPDLSDNNPFKDLNIYLIVPMISHDKLNGFICLGKPIIKNTYTKEELDFLHHIAFFSSLAINNINLNRLIVLDRKTGLYSHYYFYENLEIECNKSLRYNTALSLIMCDLDDFKQINDSYGHMAGDMVIRTFST